MADTESPALAYALSMLREGHLSIDAEGRIWRTAILHRGRWYSVPARRAENIAGKGYLRLSLYIEGRLRSVMAHRLIWTWLVGPIPPHLQMNHKDLNKKNNRLENLELVTPAGNMAHSYENGRPYAWTKDPQRPWRGKERWTAERVAELKNARRDGATYPQLAVQFGLSVTHAHRLCNR